VNGLVRSARALGVVLGLAGCGAVYRYPDSKNEESAAACSDGIDDDLDGKTDCEDPGCASFCLEHDAATCADGRDNDSDGKLDCEDSDCALFCPETSAAVCTDGIDNDLDGKRDCEDDGCADFCREHTSAECSDGIDNDLDGKTDCDDPECASLELCVEGTAAHCVDGRDNDLDGAVDCADDDCRKFAFCREDAADTCADGVDNDLDGKKDCDDADCKSWCREHDAERCADGLDNDEDGRVDCDDSSCDGFCTEEDPAACSDGRDNDGDGLADAADPLCWPFTPPALTRCASLGAQDISQNFDDTNLNAADISFFGSGQALAPRAAVLTARIDGALELSGSSASKSLDSASLSGVALVDSVSGGWCGFELGFSLYLLAGTKLEVGLVPSALVPDGRNPVVGPESALVAITLDGSVVPPAIALDVEGRHLTGRFTLPSSCGTAFCNDGWGTTKLVLGDDGFTLTVSSPLKNGATDTTTLSAPAPVSEQIAPSRLVVWGGGPADGSVGAWIDDLWLRHRGVSPCGVDVPQVPEAAGVCERSALPVAIGRTVGVARAADGNWCALVSAGEVTADPTRVFAYHSDDGASWRSGDDAVTPHELAVPSDASLTGAAIARDDEGKRWLAAVGYRTKQGVELGLSTSDDCETWEDLAAGPELPADAEAPSYVLASKQHQIYFTRPPTDETGRTLWRVSGPSQAELALETDPLYEIPAEVRAVAPVTVQRVGASDLVLTFPELSVGGPAGAGVLVGDASGTTWQALPAAAFALSNAIGAAFDSDGVSAAALSFSDQGGVLVYGGRHTDAADPSGRIETGTALVAAAGQTPPLPAGGADARCGDGDCDADETCDGCPADCDCSALAFPSVSLDDASAWQTDAVLRDGPGSPESSAYLEPNGEQLGFSALDGVASAYLPLAALAPSDFELSFDLLNLRGVAVVGLGAKPMLDAGAVSALGEFVPTTGVFAALAACTSDSMTSAVLLEPLTQTAAVPTPDVNQPCSYRMNLGGGAGLLLQATGASVPITLRRERGVVTVGVADGSASSIAVGSNGADGTCATSVTERAASNQGELGGVVVEGAFGTGSIRNVRLRRLEDPAACPEGETKCGKGADASCVDLSVTPDHCGACTTACSPDQACIDGACTCPPGSDDCSGVCVDTQASDTDCGGCGNVCSGRCQDGVCLGGRCASPYVVPPEGTTVQFTLAPAVPANFDPPPQCVGQIASEAVFTWTPATSGTADLRLSAGNYSSLAIGPTCGAYPACVTDSSFSGQIELFYPVSAGTTYFIFVAHPAFETVSASLTVIMEP
jgi:hypothetical protein